MKSFASDSVSWETWKDVVVLFLCNFNIGYTVWRILAFNKGSLGRKNGWKQLKRVSSSGACWTWGFLGRLLLPGQVTRQQSYSEANNSVLMVFGRISRLPWSYRGRKRRRAVIDVVHWVENAVGGGGASSENGNLNQFSMLTSFIPSLLWSWPLIVNGGRASHPHTSLTW